MLRPADKLLCLIYAVIAIVALIATWANNLAFMLQPENRDLAHWVAALYSNYASASFTNDLFMLGLASSIFVLVEGRRLRIRWVWAYILLSGPIAISVTFPLFLIARQIALARLRTQDAAPA